MSTPYDAYWQHTQASRGDNDERPFSTPYDDSDSARAASGPSASAVMDAYSPPWLHQDQAAAAPTDPDYFSLSSNLPAPRGYLDYAAVFGSDLNIPLNHQGEWSNMASSAPLGFGASWAAPAHRPPAQPPIPSLASPALSQPSSIPLGSSPQAPDFLTPGLDFRLRPASFSPLPASPDTCPAFSSTSVAPQAALTRNRKRSRDDKENDDPVFSRPEKRRRSGPETERGAQSPEPAASQYMLPAYMSDYGGEHMAPPPAVNDVGQGAPRQQQLPMSRRVQQYLEARSGRTNPNIARHPPGYHSYPAADNFYRDERRATLRSARNLGVSTAGPSTASVEGAPSSHVVDQAGSSSTRAAEYAGYYEAAPTYQPVRNNHPEASAAPMGYHASPQLHDGYPEQSYTPAYTFPPPAVPWSPQHATTTVTPDTGQAIPAEELERHPAPSTVSASHRRAPQRTHPQLAEPDRNLPSTSNTLDSAGPVQSDAQEVWDPAQEVYPNSDRPQARLRREEHRAARRAQADPYPRASPALPEPLPDEPSTSTSTSAKTSAKKPGNKTRRPLARCRAPPRRPPRPRPRRPQLPKPAILECPFAASLDPQETAAPAYSPCKRFKRPADRDRHALATHLGVRFRCTVPSATHKTSGGRLGRWDAATRHFGFDECLGRAGYAAAFRRMAARLGIADADADADGAGAVEMDKAQRLRVAAALRKEYVQVRLPCWKEHPLRATYAERIRRMWGEGCSPKEKLEGVLHTHGVLVYECGCCEVSRRYAEQGEGEEDGESEDDAESEDGAGHEDEADADADAEGELDADAYGEHDGNITVWEHDPDAESEPAGDADEQRAAPSTVAAADEYPAAETHSVDGGTGSKHPFALGLSSDADQDGQTSNGGLSDPNEDLPTYGWGAQPSPAPASESVQEAPQGTSQSARPMAWAGQEHSHAAAAAAHWTDSQPGSESEAHARGREDPESPDVPLRDLSNTLSPPRRAPDSSLRSSATATADSPTGSGSATSPRDAGTSEFWDRYLAELSRPVDPSWFAAPGRPEDGLEFLGEFEWP